MEELVHETPPPGDVDLESGPTPSANANRLIARCLEAAAGRLDSDSLRVALATCSLELSEAKGAFYSQVQGEEGLIAALPEAIEAVMDGFDAYGEALGQAISWLTRPEPQVLEVAAGALTEAYLSVHQALLAYEWAYLSYGDEPHPALNLMQKVMASLRQRLMDDERFDEILDYLWGHFNEGLQVYEQEPDPRKAWRGAEACREALAGVETMDGYLAFHDRRPLERGFAQFRRGCLLLVEAIQISTGEALIQTPTPSPQVNWVIHAARAVMDGVPADLLQRAQTWFEAQLSETHFRFEQCAAAAMNGSPQMAEQVDVAREGFDWLNRALPLLRMGAQARELLPRAIEHLEEGATLLYEAWTLLSLYEAEESSVFCPRCGSSNPAYGKACLSCGAELTSPRQAVAASAAAAGEVPANLHHLLNACEDARTGRMSREEFSQALDWADSLLREADQALSRLPAEENMEPEVLEVLQELRQGMAEFRSGLVELDRFVHDGRTAHIKGGTNLLIGAGDRLAQVQNRVRSR